MSRTFGAIRQIAFIVHDLDAALRYWTETLGVGPFFVNTIAGFLIALSAFLLRGDDGNMKTTVLFAVLMWLALSVAMHSFPSKGDAKGIWGTVSDRSCPVMAKVVAIPIVGFIYLGALGSMFWLNLVYAVAVTVGLPAALGIKLW